MFAGPVGDRLIAAGGTQFLNGIPSWDGGTKSWSDRVYVLEPGARAWRIADEKLPRALGDGASVAHGSELICIGGGDTDRAYADVFALAVVQGRVTRRSLPSLPNPCLKMAAVAAGDVVYVIGGRSEPNSRETSRAFWALDLSASTPRWETLPPFPGPSRMMPILAARENQLYLFGGIEVAPDGQGRPVNQAPYLVDAYRYLPGKKGGEWRRLAAPPRPLAAAPSPAWVTSQGITIFGGIDGAIEAIPQKHRGSIKALPGAILRYDDATDTWAELGAMPPETVRVNAPAFAWRDKYVIISGEHLPSRRTTACTVVAQEPAPKTKKP